MTKILTGKTSILCAARSLDLSPSEPWALTDFEETFLAYRAGSKLTRLIYSMVESLRFGFRGRLL